MTSSSLDDRRLLASVHRWARTNGWRTHWYHPGYGWVNGTRSTATLAIEWSDTALILHRVTGYLATDQPVWSQPTVIRVASVVQAVDVLVALGILPAWLSSSWAAAEDRYREQVETLEEDLARKDHQIQLLLATMAAQAAEVAELRPVAAGVQFAAIGGAA